MLLPSVFENRKVVLAAKVTALALRRKMARWKARAILKSLKGTTVSLQGRLLLRDLLRFNDKDGLLYAEFPGLLRLWLLSSQAPRWHPYFAEPSAPKKKKNAAGCSHMTCSGRVTDGAAEAPMRARVRGGLSWRTVFWGQGRRLCSLKFPARCSTSSGSMSRSDTLSTSNIHGSFPFVL